MKSASNDVKITFARWSHPDKLPDVLRKCLSDFDQKMSRYKLEDYQTVILFELEISDISDLSPNNINEAFLSIKADLIKSQIPDHIYLIETGLDDWSIVKLNTNYEDWDVMARWIPKERKVERWNNIT